MKHWRADKHKAKVLIFLRHALVDDMPADMSANNKGAIGESVGGFNRVIFKVYHLGAGFSVVGL